MANITTQDLTSEIRQNFAAMRQRIINEEISVPTACKLLFQIKTIILKVASVIGL